MLIILRTIHFALDAFQLSIMALMTMTLFLRTELHRNNMDDAGLYSGALFFTLIMIMFNGMAEISMTIAEQLHLIIIIIIIF